MEEEKLTLTRGNVIVENIKVGDIHYEYDMGMGIKCQVIEAPNLNDGQWEWKSKNLISGRIIEYSVPDVNSENYKYMSQLGIKLYDYEAYRVSRYI
jgi:hypothetical protein